MPDSDRSRAPLRRGALGNPALLFVLLIGVLSFFADFTYEGARSVIGPFLATFGASATIIGIVTGLGECIGYVLRLGTGRLADATGKFWPITIVGYVVQMAAVPALALAGNWPVAAALIILERIGKAIRNPPRDVMLSHAATRIGGYGWAFGLHEAFDQAGAMVGPLVVAVVLARRGSYSEAFAVLLVPALINLIFVGLARLAYPDPSAFEDKAGATSSDRGLPSAFWIYLCAAALAAAGFADYPLIAYHFARTGVATGDMIAILYAVAMAVSGAGSLLLGRLFDRFGFAVLVGLTLISALFAPLVFFGGPWIIAVGAAIWGLGTGGQESIIPAAVAPMVPANRRATAFGLFTAVYGVAWFIGSAAIGILYDRSVGGAVVFCVALELLALAPLVVIWIRTPRRQRRDT